MWYDLRADIVDHNEKRRSSHTLRFSRKSPQLRVIERIAFSFKSQTYGGKTSLFCFFDLRIL
jgi:hypothetical protein